MDSKQWTTKLRYQAYQDWPATRLQQIQQRIKHSTWRFGYHIQPTTGLLNDPNGFAYYNHQWHLFYQAFPFGAVHGLKSWVELTSPDLVHWQNHGPKLLPDSDQDRQGAYSGSAIPVNDKLFIMYTGNVRDQNWVRHPKQNGAWLDPNDQLTKLDQSLIAAPQAGYTEHFRDPQIIQHGDQYYAIIGAQRADKTGHVLMYKASQVTGPWEYFTELKFTDQPLGYMVECPNLVFIHDQPVLIFCPQGIDQSVLKHANVYPNAYVMGQSFDWSTGTINLPGPITNLDAGFDVYATQAFNAPDGRVLAVSWIGLPDTTYPSDQEDWANCLSLVKELQLVDQHLYQLPVQETALLIENKLPLAHLGQQFKFSVTVPANLQTNLTLTTTEADTGLQISIDTKNGKLVVDRSQAGVPCSVDFGQTRNCFFTSGRSLTVEGYVDHSVFELYLNHGETTLTGRFFGNRTDFNLQIPTQLKANAWRLETTNKD